MIVHVDRVRHMRLEDQEEAFCSNKARQRGVVPPATQEFRDLPKNDDICQNPDEKIDDGNVGYFPPDEDLQEFPESDTEDEDNVEDAVQPETPERLAPADLSLIHI